MNTNDRSVGYIDEEVRRGFDFEKQGSDANTMID